MKKLVNLSVFALALVAFAGGAFACPGDGKESASSDNTTVAQADGKAAKTKDGKSTEGGGDTGGKVKKAKGGKAKGGDNKDNKDGKGGG
ncbi:MAG: hypothetical protein GMKNLPBB_01707 [Myxococcota bacterium]|nr:hypothetical protein [Myxococcota bacterium]